MKRVFIFFLLVLFAFPCAWAQEIHSVTSELKRKYTDVYYDRDDNYYKVEQNGLEAIFSRQGKMLVDFRYNEVMWYQLDEGGCCEVELNGKVGAIDKNGKEVIPCKYDEIAPYPFSEGEEYCEVKLNKKFGVVDKKGREVIPCKYDYIAPSPFSDGETVCEVKLNGKVGVIKKSGKVLLPCKYDNVREYDFDDEDEKYVEVRLNGKLGLVDKNGKEFLACKYDSIQAMPLTDDEKFCRVRIGKGLGLVNEKGEEVIPTQYSYIYRYDYDREENVEYVRVTKEGDIPEGNAPPQGAKWGLCSLKARKEVVPCVFDYIIGESEGVVLFVEGGSYDVKMNKHIGGKYGYAAVGDGKVLIPAQYDEAALFKDGVAQVIKNGQVSLLINPLTGTNMTLLNGVAGTEVDRNIPTTGKTQEETFAFIIANENYEKFKGSDFAINDGKIFREYCRKTFGLPEHNVHYYEDATFGNLAKMVKRMQDIAEVYEGSVDFIVYYSGLGATDEKNGERYLLPTDATLATLSSTGYNLNQLMSELNNMKTRTTTIIIDSPFNGCDKNGDKLETNRGVMIKPSAIAPQGNVTLCLASGNAETAYCMKDAGHGLFTFTLLEKLMKTKGEITMTDLLEYTKGEVKKSSLKIFKKVQSPTIVGQQP